MLDHEKILKKLGKKHRFILRLLVSGNFEADRGGRLEILAKRLLFIGLVRRSGLELELTDAGKEFLNDTFSEVFQDVPDDREAILDKLLLRQPLAGPKVTKKERLFLALLSEGPIKLKNIRGGQASVTCPRGRWASRDK